MKEQRIMQLEEYIRIRDVCTIEELREHFNISIATLRRDIEVLSEKGLIRKVYGGIKLNRSTATSTVPFHLREIKNINEKEYIGKLAATLIGENETIFIDSGTTTIFLTKHLMHKKVTIVTNNLSVMNECTSSDDINIVNCGGVYSKVTNSFGGDIACKTLSAMNLNKAFIASTGVSFTAGFTNSQHLETPIKKTAIKKAGEIYVMIDSSKWDVVSIMTFCEIKEVKGIITDKRPPKKFEKYFDKIGLEVYF